MNIFIGLLLLVTLVSVIQAEPTQEELDDHFIYLGNHEIITNSAGTGRSSKSKRVFQWYLSRTDKVDWSSAIAACKTFDMTLAEMNSESAFDVFQGYMTNFNWVHQSYFRAFVGITKPSNSQTWYRASNSQKVTFNLVVNSKPNDILGKRCLTADVHSYHQAALFDSANCSEKNFYICEKFTGEASGIA